MYATKDVIEVIGIGDMSGDVFGNGMLLSSKLKLIAAFNHRRIFVDPAPDPASSFRERKRLFGLSDSSWSDYDSSVLSAGGAVFNRSAKKLTLSRPVRKKFSIKEKNLTPDRLIGYILRARAELLWFGGIGTYIKASHENNLEVGDKANDAVRIDATALRVKVIGEGANLGMTMAARIEFASHGGWVATDSNDNSGGVHCSDREVNIKILLSLLERQGTLTRAGRNRLLKNMTENVAQQVLAENYSQNLSLSLESRQAADLYAHHIQITRDLGAESLLQLSPNGNPLTRPQLAMLMGCYKNALKEAFADHHLFDYPYLTRQLPFYYPARLRRSAGKAMLQHPLANRILGSLIVNHLTNGLGLALDPEDPQLPVWARSFYQLNDIFSFISLFDSLASHLSVYPRLLPFLYGLRVTCIRALYWLRNQDMQNDGTIKKWAQLVGHCARRAPSSPLFSHSYKSLVALGIEEKHAINYALAVEADALILLLPLMDKWELTVTLDLFSFLSTTLALPSIKQGLHNMEGQSRWRRMLAQDMSVHLYRQLERLMKVLLKGAARGASLDEWRSANRLVLEQYHQAISERSGDPDAPRIQFLIGLIAKLSPSTRS